MSEMRANPLISAEVSESTAPIPLTHNSVLKGPSNSSDDFKEVSPSNSLEAEDDYYKMLLEDCDGGYERKTSPMMSPIISPVTAC
jgi:hypothetical protein